MKGARLDRDSPTNAFFVGSPLQLLNAVEARHQLLAEGESAVLILHPGPAGIECMAELVESEPWQRVWHLHAGGTIAFWRSLRTLGRIVKHHAPFGALFLGDYRFDMMRHFANAAEPERLVLLDDGNGTLAEAEQGIDDELNPSSARKLKSMVKRHFCRLDSKPRPAREYFTVYDLPEGGGQKVTRNTYAFLRSRTQSGDPVPLVYFLGSPLPQVGILTTEMYMKYLSAVKGFFGGESVVYIPHRRETPSILAKIEAQVGLRARPLQRIIELDLCLSGGLPKALAGFTSAALLNCRLIFGDALDIKCFQLRSEHVRGSHREESEKVYDYYRTRLDVILLPPFD